MYRPNTVYNNIVIYDYFSNLNNNCIITCSKHGDYGS